MRQSIKDFVSIAAAALPIGEPIYEFGAFQVPGQEGFADLRPYFPRKEYIGVDVREGLGVDKLLDLHNIDLPSGSVGTVLCFDTLEHLEHPLEALKQIHRVLKPDGVAVIGSVMNFPIHDYPRDYWRFTPEAFGLLLKPFAGSFVGSAGRKDFPHTVVGIGFKGALPCLREFNRQYKQWQSSHIFQERGSLFKQTVKLLAPPIFMPVLLNIFIAISGLKYKFYRRVEK